MTLPFVRGSAVCRDRGGGETGGGGGREGETKEEVEFSSSKLNFHLFISVLRGSVR